MHQQTDDNQRLASIYEASCRRMPGGVNSPVRAFKFMDSRERQRRWEQKSRLPLLARIEAGAFGVALARARAVLAGIGGNA